jgi:ABC-type methionine transport system ATPase subunit
LAGEAEILRGVTFAVQAGGVFSVVGPSGAGKRTLLRTINRLVESTAGNIFLDGTPIEEINPLELRRRIGMVFQLPALFGDTVEDSVLYGVRLAGKCADVERLLGLAGLAPSLASRNPQSLSVGQQQRVPIARALALEPEVLLMDEPTSALDQVARQRIEDLIRQLNKELGLTIVVVSHALDQVERIADRVVLLIDGRSEVEWSKEEFFGKGVGEKARRFVEGEL